jgi:TusA-related sulfurtransferase
MAELPADLRVDRVFDGGDLDCGSGLVLLLRENLLQVPEGGVLEMRSREPSVKDDLPAWCRMVGHELLGSMPGEEGTRYFLRRGIGTSADASALVRDREQARAYSWRTRVRGRGRAESTVYCRNHSWAVGQPASFEEKDPHPSAVEYVLGALGADLAAGFATVCARAGCELDDLEITVHGTLRDVMAHLGASDGDPGFERIEVTCFASLPEDEARVRPLWEETVRRSPLAATFARGAELRCRLALG